MFRPNTDGTMRDQRWDCQDGYCARGVVDPGSNYGACVNIWAPAWQVNLAHFQTTTSYRPQDTTNPLNSGATASNGTSFSAPLVAGLVARILQKNPTMPAASVINELLVYSSTTGADANPDLLGVQPLPIATLPGSY